MLEWVWAPIALVSLACNGLVCLVALFVYASNARRLQNRLLALAFACIALGSSAGSGLTYATRSAEEAFAWQVVAFVFFCPGIVLYLAFLSTLPTPLARPLARARPALYALAPLAAALPLARPLAFTGEMLPGAFSPWEMTGGWASTFMWWTQIAVSGVALVLAVSAWRRAKPGTLAREQARAYLVAFGWFDAAALLAVGGGITWGWSEAQMNAWNVANALFVPLLAYGVLKGQLFDIDLKVKWTVRRGTLVSAFVAAFFVVAAVAEQYLERYGVLAGGVAVGLLLFALRPVERLADRFADRAMPTVRDTAEYRIVRKREVYRAAVEGALEDGGVSDKERGMLARLAHQLGLDPMEMHEIEREARAAQGVG